MASLIRAPCQHSSLRVADQRPIGWRSVADLGGPRHRRPAHLPAPQWQAVRSHGVRAALSWSAHDHGLAWPVDTAALLRRGPAGGSPLCQAARHVCARRCILQGWWNTGREYRGTFERGLDEAIQDLQARIGGADQAGNHQATAEVEEAKQRLKQLQSLQEWLRYDTYLLQRRSTRSPRMIGAGVR